MCDILPCLFYVTVCLRNNASVGARAQRHPRQRWASQRTSVMSVPPLSHAQPSELTATWHLKYTVTLQMVPDWGWDDA